ncbi:MAG: hypothetical protein SFU53_16055 [Terrimicrobiaceae bacterium]|nr:hypothetical protein [Terrimicrobiaceae bacterium]
MNRSSSEIGGFLEVLEDRIAPASVTFSQGGNLLSSGDEGLPYQGAPTPIIKVLAGKALVFWDPQNQVIKGISVSDKARLEIFADVDGDIVTNLNKDGTLTDSDGNVANGLDGGKLLASSISGIRIQGGPGLAGNPVAGSVDKIVAGGSISNVFVAGEIGGIYAGDGIFDAIATGTSSQLAHGTPTTTFEFRIGFDIDGNGPINATSMFLKMSDAEFATKASVAGVGFTSGKNVQIFAGDGFNGGTGGAISNVSLVAAAADPLVASGFFQGKALTVSSGDGGDGSQRGGTGGAVSSITDLASSGTVAVYSGVGGVGAQSGGAGGLVTLLDMRGNPDLYVVQSGSGGSGTTGGAGGWITNSNVASTSSSQFITLAGNFHSDFQDGAPAAADKGFFLIDKSSGEMVLIAGNTLTQVGNTIQPLAAGPVDAVVADVNADNFLDVVVAYADGRFGVLVNNQADGFRYSVGSLDGVIPQQVLVGDFIGNGTPNDIVFIGSTTTTTTIRLFEVVDSAAFDGSDPASAYASDPSKIQVFTFNKGNLADAVGGSFPLSTLGSLRLNGDVKDDIVLAFRDGTIQGVFSTGLGTQSNPLTFNAGTKSDPAPQFVVKNGVRDLDFNYAKGAGQQRISIVDGLGQAVWIATVTPGGGATSLALGSEPLALPASQTVPTLLEARWTTSILDAGKPGTPEDATPNTLAVLGTNGNTSTLLTYNGRFELTSTTNQNVLLNSMTNNFLFTSVPPENTTKTTGEATSWLFTGGDPTEALAYQEKLPKGQLSFAKVALPFDAKTVEITAGNGGNGSSGKGGEGGRILSLNVNSGDITIQTGHGGDSNGSAAGRGGLFDNIASFITPDRIALVPTLTAKGSLNLLTGNGGTANGSTAAARGGAGGDIQNVIFGNYGSLLAGAGDGGNSLGGASGAGGVIRNLTIFSGADGTLNAGDGGDGSVGLKASGGVGGLVTNIKVGDPDLTQEKVVSGNLQIVAGDGGSSSFAAPGAGGNVSLVTAGGLTKSLGAISVAAGDGGSTPGSGNGASGGSVLNVTLNNVRGNSSFDAGDGGSSGLGKGGIGGNIKTISATNAGLVSAIAGDGGSSTDIASKAAGGAGGSVSSLVADMRASGFAIIQSGSGGSAVGAAGGAGGNISTVSVKLNPTEQQNLTTMIGLSVLSGSGGNGTAGGRGGGISGFDATGVYDESSGNVSVISSIALRMSAGNGGVGSLAAGGAGGSVSLSKPLAGISSIAASSTNPNFLPEDEGLRVFAGDGGDGVTAGGAGGNISGVRSTNVPNSAGAIIPFNLLGGAYLHAGDGGDTQAGAAGKGGSVTNSNLSVQGQTTFAGNLRVESGNGGMSLSGNGGAGGNVSGGTLVVIKGNDLDGYGLLARAGSGGDGAVRGGAGGNLSNLSTTLPQLGVDNSSPKNFSGVFLAGDGGNGTGSALSTGGIGGSVSGIKQNQNVNSVINIVLAGSGGDSSGDVAGAKGGSVKGVNTVGSIGAQTAKETNGGNPIPQGLYNTVATSALVESFFGTPDVAQGVFAGLGGQGLTQGTNGTVSGISAQAIAALAAANSTGSFEQAVAISSIRSLLVAFDPDGNNTYDPGDGFVLVNGAKVNGLSTYNSKLVSTSALQARTAIFTNP